MQRTSHPDLIKSSQEPRLLAGEAVALLDGGDGALHVARHQQLRQLQQTVAEHEELQRRRRSESRGKREKSNMAAGVTLFTFLNKVNMIKTHHLKFK